MEKQIFWLWGWLRVQKPRDEADEGQRLEGGRGGDIWSEHAIRKGCCLAVAWSWGPSPYKGGLAGNPKKLFPGAELGGRLGLLFQAVEQIALPRLASSKSRWQEPPCLASFPTSDPCAAPSENSSRPQNTCLPPAPPPHGGSASCSLARGPGVAGKGRKQRGMEIICIPRRVLQCSCQGAQNTALSPRLSQVWKAQVGPQLPAPGQGADQKEVSPYGLRARGTEGPCALTTAGPLPPSLLPP